MFDILQKAACKAVSCVVYCSTFVTSNCDGAVVYSSVHKSAHGALNFVGSLRRVRAMIEALQKTAGNTITAEN